MTEVHKPGEVHGHGGQPRRAADGSQHVVLLQGERRLDVDAGRMPGSEQQLEETLARPRR